LILLIFFTLVLGMLDLAWGVFRYHMIGEAARQGARQAIVHGSMADRLLPWGPADYAGTAEDGSPLAKAVESSLHGLELSEVTIQAQWIDGGNDPEQRVRVTVSAPYRPIMTFIFGNPAIPLQAASTMAIAH
jgi:hypothetical protein